MNTCLPIHIQRGFTLIELLVVLAIVALLLSIVTPRYLHKTEAAKETVLKEHLASLRTSIDHYYGDHEVYPPTLDTLVEERYLRAIPTDPITQRNDSWQITLQELNGINGVYDVHSGAPGTSRNGSAYATW